MGDKRERSHSDYGSPSDQRDEASLRRNMAITSLRHNKGVENPTEVDILKEIQSLDLGQDYEKRNEK